MGNENTLVICPTCRLPRSDWPMGYAGPMCKCRFSYGMNPLVFNVNVYLKEKDGTAETKSPDPK